MTDVPEGKLPVQVEGQLIPEGLLVTVPLPVTVTASCTFWGGGGCVLGLLEQPVSTTPKKSIDMKENARRVNVPILANRI